MAKITWISKACRYDVFPILGTGDIFTLSQPWKDVTLVMPFGAYVKVAFVGRLSGEFMYYANTNREQWGIIPLVKQSGNHMAWPTF